MSVQTLRDTHDSPEIDSSVVSPHRTPDQSAGALTVLSVVCRQSFIAQFYGQYLSSVGLVLHCSPLQSLSIFSSKNLSIH